MIDNIYNKNIDNLLFTEELQKILLTKNIAVIGCGGNGGYILEYLVRLGVKSLSFWDGDSYDESNLNRQTGCTMSTIGQNKADVMYQKLKEINPTIKLHNYDWYFSTNSEDLNKLLEHDLIILANDNSYNVSLVRQLVRLAIINHIPVIDQGLDIIGGYISLITEASLELYDKHTIVWESPIRANELCSQPAYKCAYIASEVINTMVQYFNNHPFVAKNSELVIDLYHHKINWFDQFGKIY